MERIHLAAYEGKEADVSQLVQEDGRRLNAQIQGAEVKVWGWYVGGCTPLMLAAWKGHDTVVTRLIELGADVRLSDAQRQHAVHWACRDRRESTLGLLLDAGAALNVLNNLGWAPPTCAACQGVYPGATDCVEVLLTRGGDALDVNSKNLGKGQTALHVVARDGLCQTVKLLLHAGADPTIRDNDGRTPLDDARLHNRASCIALLQAAVAEPQRPRLLLKARALLDAAHAVPKAANDARDKGQPPPMQRQASVAVAPTYLKRRVMEGHKLLRVQVAESEEDEQLVACIKYALGLEGGGVVLFEGQEPTVGMVKEVFVELCEMLVPKWDRANV